MATVLLRKVKSTILASRTNSAQAEVVPVVEDNNNKQPTKKPAIIIGSQSCQTSAPPKSRRFSLAATAKAGNKTPEDTTGNQRRPIDLSTAVESAYSIRAREQYQTRLQQQRSITHLRKKLVRKASSFSLRKTDCGRRTLDTRELQRQRRIEDLFFEEEGLEKHGIDSISGSSCGSETNTDQSRTPTNVAKRPRGSGPYLAGLSTSASAKSSSTITGSFKPHTTANHLPSTFQDARTAKQNNSSSQGRDQQDLEEHNAGRNWRKMASPNAVPPLDYEKLKEITTDACDTALSSVKKYSHSETESWNTNIINTILSKLVSETTPSSSASSATPQSQFKYVVNSTIIQHATAAASATADGETKTSGRRGMHSASGAYWNNEKDGMWSFKYEAAEAKGLDVVIGIIWVWVG